MKEYNIAVYNDMGHIETHPYTGDLPRDIAEFIMFSCLTKMPYRVATDNEGIGCRFYILADGAEKNISYTYNDNIINITYDLDTFNPDKMRWLR